MEKVSKQVGQPGQHHKVPGGRMENLEEADTIIIMHAAHASADGYRAFFSKVRPLTYWRLLMRASYSR